MIRMFSPRGAKTAVQILDPVRPVLVNLSSRVYGVFASNAFSSSQSSCACSKSMPCLSRFSRLLFLSYSNGTRNMLKMYRNATSPECRNKAQGSIQSSSVAPGAQIQTQGVSPTIHVSPSWLPLCGTQRHRIISGAIQHPRFHFWIMVGVISTSLMASIRARHRALPP